MRGGLVGRKDIFLRFVFFHLVEVYFHEAVKIEIGEHRLVQIIERAIPFLRVESIVHQLGDSAVLQVGIHLNDVFLILGSGIAQIDSCQVGKVRLSDLKFVLEIILNVGERLFRLRLHKGFMLLLGEHHTAVARVSVQLPLKLLPADGAPKQGDFLIPQMHVKLPDALYRESVVILQVDNAALGANGPAFRYGTGFIAHRTGSLALRGSPCGILLQLLRRQKTLHLDQISNALGCGPPWKPALKASFLICQDELQSGRAVVHPAVRTALVVP